MPQFIVGPGGFVYQRLYHEGEVVVLPDDAKVPDHLKPVPVEPPPPVPDSTPANLGDVQTGRKARRAADSEPI
jgi:hypothetical protein